MAAAQQGASEGAAQLATPASDTDPLSRFTCPVCLEVFEKPMQVPCGHVDWGHATTCFIFSVAPLTDCVT